jgi:hypothetical protein
LKNAASPCLYLGVDKKQHILSEIKRTAVSNGGRLLGERAFYNATGINKGDWFGKFWARFSDAVKEAGFNPNEFSDEQQYSDDDMLHRYVTLAKELGRLPTNGDLRFKKSRDPQFPSSKTYETRFGLKLDLVGQLSTYCTSRPEHTNVFGWCQDYLAKNQAAATSERNVAEDAGYVYLMKSGRFFKIGWTNDVVRRGREITIQLPEQAVTVHFFRTDDPSGIEAYWHRRFADKRRNGEWFELSAKDVAAFKRRKNFM